MSEHKSIFKSASAMSVITVISRVTGFLRDVLIANIFGTGLYAQAFFVAFKIPNLFRNMIGEGAGNAAFVPVFCEYKARKTNADFLKLVNTVLLLVLGITTLISLAGIIFSSPIVRLMAPGFFQDSRKFELTVRLTRLLFPYLILVAFSACLTSAANTQNSFVVPAFSSVVFNIVLIMGILAILKMPVGGAIYYLCAAVLIAGLFQIIMQMPPLLKTGVCLKGGIYPDFLKTEAIRKIARLSGPRVIGASVYQMNIFVDTIFASLAFFTGEGAIAAIYYANRIVQLPFAIIGVAFSNAALPAMSASSASHDMDRFKRTLSFSMSAVFLGTIPSMMGILALSRGLVEVIFQRGHFDVYSTAITTEAVSFYALGLVAYAGVRFLSCAFYALQDTRTPVKISFFAFLLNILLNAVFIFILKLGIAGLALASVLSAFYNFVSLYRVLKERTGFHFTKEFGTLMTKAVTASMAMAVFVFYLWHSAVLHLPGMIKMFLVSCLGILCYVVFLMLLKVKEVWGIISWLRKGR